MEKYGTARQTTDDNTVRDMHIACWIAKATETHSEYVIRFSTASITTLHNRAPGLRYTYSGADKSLARPGRKQATATEDFDVHISYLL